MATTVIVSGELLDMATTVYCCRG
ncbi:hypothetical protein CCACVL1_19179 [Corchorus capsularis]|uniref:Uncharacterized protein n=1 Tax=Corchorus capsularis TaxID=210143 RepID=A0A1R3HI22_COCAP|nr:hypothetical protein CCACVL1_19179 [Corchorus capsularis]